jgi:hypothetical protein
MQFKILVVVNALLILQAASQIVSHASGVPISVARALSEVVLVGTLIGAADVAYMGYMQLTNARRATPLGKREYAVLVPLVLLAYTLIAYNVHRVYSRVDGPKSLTGTVPRTIAAIGSRSLVAPNDAEVRVPE